jgi:hypothetical protein
MDILFTMPTKLLPYPLVMLASITAHQRQLDKADLFLLEEEFCSLILVLT